MSRRNRSRKYSRRTAISIRRSEKTAIIIAIAVFVALCITVSVVIGILLGKRADPYESQKKFEFSRIEYLSGDKTVKSVDAYAYSLGKDAKGYISRGITDLSVCVRGSDGYVGYNSEIASLVAIDEFDADTDLKNNVDYIHGIGGYVCAYFYVNSMNIEDESLRRLYVSYELALINEISKCGVDDILLLGLDINENNIDEAERYIYEVSVEADNTVVGVCLPQEVVIMTEYDVYYAGRIRAVCDYIALDLKNMNVDAADLPADVGEGKPVSELEALIDKMYYYIESYGMRIILSKDNSALYSDVKELGVVNVQIVGQ